MNEKDVLYKTYMTDAIGPLPFCNGCGHTTLIKTLDKALVKLQLDPKEVVIVTDIGCIGLSDRYFTTNGFHGLHGRSITYACGLKLARPELTVITLMGDGASGIGGAHFLNVARRNIGITLIIGNNFNYGMTGGQHSTTTPTDGITSTTPWGNPEGPMDLCATAAAAGGAWIYRATTFDNNLEDVFATAIQQPGYAMVDVWELCTAYYMSRNELRKKELFALMESYGLSVGLQADKPRLEYSEKYRQAYEAGKSVLKQKPPIEPAYLNDVRKQTGIIIAGSAGQKIKSAATLLAEGSIFAGLKATQKDDYPITVQTGPSVAEIILSPDRIDYTGIDDPDYFVLISEDGLKRTKAKIQKLPETCVLYVDEDMVLPETKAVVRRLPFTQLQKEVGRLALSTAVIAAMLEESGLYPIEALIEAVNFSQSAKIADINIKSINAGAALTSKTRQTG